jgi:hypothetical protein
MLASTILRSSITSKQERKEKEAARVVKDCIEV